MFTKRPNIPLPNHKTREGKTKFSINLESVLKRAKQRKSKEPDENHARKLDCLPSWDPTENLEPDKDHSDQECQPEEKKSKVSSPKKSTKNPATSQAVVPEERMLVTTRTFRTQRTKEVKENRPVADEDIIAPTRCSDEGKIDCGVLLTSTPKPCSSKTNADKQNVPNKVPSEVPKKKRRRRGPPLNLPRKKNKKASITKTTSKS
eukprot:Seg1808.2 transcript_id=Seg1808.2/GoldUCD/mRNA.D3Y31 product="hypothetical protein" protein_id=Seg1808.2/GoldUCD/D3Y31